ncbi:cysteine desulfurase [bacterium]|nr:cysteine desulfurase [bacterium]
MAESFYFDHNATTPLDERVLEAMLPQLRETWGNPSSVHSFGATARYEIEKARRSISRTLGAAEPSEIVFTGGGTEADNIAIRGAALFARESRGANHLITSAVEHKAVLDTCHDLHVRDGFDLTILHVDEWGRARPADLLDALKPSTAVVSIMMANNEVGTINPIRELAAMTHEHTNAIFHTDGVQAVGRCALDLQSLGVDAFSTTAHKLYGPKGVGALYVRKGTPLAAVLTGGGQEGGLRPGTENVASIAGFAKAIDLAAEEFEREDSRLRALREKLWLQISSIIPLAIRNSPTDRCLAGTLNVSFSGTDAQRLVMEMDRRGYAISTGSACNSTGKSASHVLQALCTDFERVSSAIRISLGRTNTADQLPEFVDALRQAIAALTSH